MADDTSQTDLPERRLFRTGDESGEAEAVTSSKPQQSVFTELASSRNVVVYRRKSNSSAPLVWVSGSVRDVLGYGPREFIDDESLWFSLLHRDYHLLTDDLLRLVRANDRYVCEYEILSADGEYRWIRDEMRLVRDEEDAPLEIVGCWLDLTPYKDQRIGYSVDRARADYRELELVADLMGAHYRLRNQSLRHRDAVEALTQFKDRLEKSGARNLALNPSDTAIPIELFDRLPGVAYRVRPGSDRVLDYASRGFKEFAGIAEDDPAADMRLSLRDMTHEDVRDSNEDRISAALAADQTYTLVYPVITNAGEERWVSDHGRGFSSDGKLVAVYGFFADVTDSMSITDQVVHRVSRDQLTGLANQVEFERHVAEALDSRRDAGGQHVACFLDIDHFNLINDAGGYTAGDAVLSEISDVLRSCVRSSDVLGRLSGDEFGLLVLNCPLARALDIARSVCDALQSHRFRWEDKQFRIGTSAGVVPLTDDLQDVATVMERARFACQQAKADGRGRVRVWHANADPEIESGQITASEALELFDAGRLSLYAQPGFSARAHGEPVFFEFLLRYRNSAGTIVGPRQFMGVAERYGLLARLDRWVIRRAMDVTAEGFASNAEAGISINLTSDAMNDPGFPEYVAEEMDRVGFYPGRVTFEISEIDAVGDVDFAARFINEIKKYGCRFALDDFGAGTLSFAQLKQLPVDAIKIDGRLLRDAADSAVDRAMISAIASVAKEMGIETIAEQVESASVAEILGGLGVDYIQGNVLGTPAPTTADVPSSDVPAL